ncbi:MAG: DUF4870 domain-containing protein [Armatimonadetes bacterium]|nr:DUF4870 domain-containing protein [Armatimonadota bacterium]
MSQEEKTWGALAHVIPLVAALMSSFGWVAALVIWLLYKDKSKFVAFHALQQAFFMLAVWVLALIGVVLFVTVVGIPIAILVWIVCLGAAIGGPIYAAIKASNGGWWEYPLVGKVALNAVGK